MTLTNEQYVGWLRTVNACDPALDWANEQGLPLTELWGICPYAGWNAFIPIAAGVSLKVVMVKVAPLVETPDGPLTDVKRTLVRWARGRATTDDVKDAMILVPQDDRSHPIHRLAAALFAQDAARSVALAIHDEVDGASVKSEFDPAALDARIEGQL